MRKIKPFKVFKHPTLGYQSVKIGFSWPGLFFSGIWLLTKKLWGYAFVFLSISIFLSFMEAAFEKEESLAGMVLVLWLEIGVYIFVGVKGNEWRAANLQKRGFELIDTVQAETPMQQSQKSKKSEVRINYCYRFWALYYAKGHKGQIPLSLFQDDFPLHLQENMF